MLVRYEWVCVLCWISLRCVWGGRMLVKCHCVCVDVGQVCGACVAPEGGLDTPLLWG